MKLRSLTVVAAALVLLFVGNASAVSEIVVAVRYLQAEGVSHSHLYLYLEDGKFLRQLTNDKSGQDVDPIFAPDGTSIVFVRERTNSPLEFWSIEPLGAGLKKLDAAPDWYEQAKTSMYFTNRDIPKAEESASPAPEASASPGQSGLAGGKQTYKTPDGSVELILREDPKDPDDQVDGEHHGKHYMIRYLKTGLQADFGTLPGFFGVYEILHERQDPDRVFLIEGLLRVAFFGLHLNSTDGDMCSALDLNGPRLVRLSPNWAAPIPLPGESAFLTLTENRYVPIPGSSKTANCSYVEHWDAQLQKIRYARTNTAAICYGASMYRQDRTPAVIAVRQNAD
jgi:WD40 repeat protein